VRASASLPFSGVCASCQRMDIAKIDQAVRRVINRGVLLVPALVSLDMKKPAVGPVSRSESGGDDRIRTGE
jgi:hypothetical protein